MQNPNTSLQAPIHKHDIKSTQNPIIVVKPINSDDNGIETFIEPSWGKNEGALRLSNRTALMHVFQNPKGYIF